MNLLNRLSIPELNLSDQIVHVFLFGFSPETEKEFYPCLSAEEISRAEKLKIDQKRMQFVISRGVLRHALAICSGKNPNEISFSYGQHCKPGITNKFDNKKISFNVSHSGDYGLIGLTLDNELGVDIEERNEMIDYQSLADRFFSNTEKQELSMFDADKQLDAFYRLWTKKESFIKATGEGVAFGLDRFSVSLEKNIHTINVNKETNAEWYCHELVVLENYKAALTVSKRDIEIVRLMVGGRW